MLDRKKVGSPDVRTGSVVVFTVQGVAETRAAACLGGSREAALQGEVHW